jgi:hypothetical protein
MLTRKIELKDLVNPKLQNLICYLAAKTEYLTEKRVHKLLYTAELYYIEHFYNSKTINLAYGVQILKVRRIGLMVFV